MHIARTVKLNVPPSSSFPGGRQYSISLIHDNDLRKPGVAFFLKKKKKGENREVCHMKS